MSGAGYLLVFSMLDLVFLLLQGSKHEKTHRPCTFPTAGEYATENAEVSTTERRGGNANLFLSEKEVPEHDTRLGVPELQCGMWDKKEDSTQQESNIQILHSEGNLHSTELVTPMCIMYDGDKGASCPTSKLHSTFSSRWFGGWTGNVRFFTFASVPSASISKEMTD
jgi:hypothetical protein